MRIELPKVCPSKTRTDALLRARSVIAGNDAVLTGVNSNLVQAQKVIVDNSKLLPSQPDSPWIILLSSFSLQDEAKAEQNKNEVIANGFPNVLIYKNRKRYRTALSYHSREEAAAALQAVMNQLANDAYMVDLKTWCANGVTVKPDPSLGYVDCGGESLTPGTE